MGNDHNSPRQDRIIDDGKLAAQEGKSLDACPYDFQLMDRAAWILGWTRGGGNIHTRQVKP